MFSRPAPGVPGWRSRGSTASILSRLDEVGAANVRNEQPARPAYLGGGGEPSPIATASYIPYAWWMNTFDSAGLR